MSKIYYSQIETMLYGKYAGVAILYFALLTAVSPQNLFCNSDFEAYRINSNTFIWAGYNMSNRGYNNDQCWQMQGQTYFLVETVWNYSTYTKMVKLAFNGSQLAICQNATLQVGALYNYTFQIAMFPEMASSTGYSYINSVLVKSVTAFADSFPKLTTITHIFSANSSINLFCAKGSETWEGENKTEIYGLSTQFDNFFLIKVGEYKTPTIVQFSVRTHQKQRRIQLSTSDYLPMQTLQHISNSTTIKIKGQLQTQVQFTIEEGNLLTIWINFDKIADLKTLQLEIAGMFIADSQETILAAGYVFDGLKTMYYPLQEGQIQKLHNMESLSSQLFGTFFTLFNGAKMIGCSYFLANLISFYSLITLYNFLNLSAQPTFSYDIVRFLVSLFFDNGDNIVTFLQNRLFGGNPTINETLSSILKYDEKNSMEIMPQQINGYVWFGSFGVTPNFFENNFVGLFVLFSLIVKLFSLFIIGHFLPPSIGKYLKKKIFYAEIFVVQFIINSTTMSISAMSILLYSQISSFEEKVNYFLQTVCLMIVISSLFFYYFILQYKQWEEKLQKQGKQGKGNKRKVMLRKTKLFWERVFCTLQLGFQIIVPLLMAIGNKVGSIIVLTLYFCGILFCFCKGHTYFPAYKKVYRFILLLIFGLHHFSFLIMTAVSIFSDKSFFIAESVGYVCQICGFVVIATIICGGLSQMIQFVIQILFEIVIPNVKKLIKRIKKQIKHIKQTRQKNQKNKESSSNKSDQMIPADEVSHISTPASKVTNRMRIITKDRKIKNQRRVFEQSKKPAHIMKITIKR